jgi:hypothetical protein
MATKQKYEVRFNSKRKKYELLKAGNVFISSDSEERANHLMSVFKNYPFAPKVELVETEE